MRRYDGNSGRYIHIPDEPGLQRRNPPQQSDRQKQRIQNTEGALEFSQDPNVMPPPKQIGSGIQNILSKIFAQGFEVEDLLLFAVLFLMYQETKDKELLIIMGGMFLL